MTTRVQSGLGAALDALDVAGAVRAGAEPEPGAEQLGLLPLSPAKDTAGAAIQNRPGRPPGSRSKRTEQWVDFLLSRYRSPLIGLAEIYSRPLVELAAELKCTPLEAMQMQLAAMDKLAPYLHQKLPQALQVQVEKAIPLILAVMPPGEADLGAIEQNQDLIPLLPGHVARDELHVTAKAEPAQRDSNGSPLTGHEGGTDPEAPA
jgi:hypothetical protein